MSHMNRFIHIFSSHTSISTSQFRSNQHDNTKKQRQTQKSDRSNTMLFRKLLLMVIFALIFDHNGLCHAFEKVSDAKKAKRKLDSRDFEKPVRGEPDLRQFGPDFTFKSGKDGLETLGKLGTQLVKTVRHWDDMNTLERSGAVLGCISKSVSFVGTFFPPFLPFAGLTEMFSSWMGGESEQDRKLKRIITAVENIQRGLKELSFDMHYRFDVMAIRLNQMEARLEASMKAFIAAAVHEIKEASRQKEFRSLMGKFKEKLISMNTKRQAVAVAQRYVLSRVKDDDGSGLSDLVSDLKSNGTLSNEKWKKVKSVVKELKQKRDELEKLSITRNIWPQLLDPFQFSISWLNRLEYYQHFAEFVDEYSLLVRDELLAYGSILMAVDTLANLDDLCHFAGDDLRGRIHRIKNDILRESHDTIVRDYKEFIYRFSDPQSADESHVTQSIVTSPRTLKIISTLLQIFKIDFAHLVQRRKWNVELGDLGERVVRIAMPASTDFLWHDTRYNDLSTRIG